MTTISEQIRQAKPGRVRDADGAPGTKVPGFTGQGWSSHETMLAFRWLLARPDAWDQVMAAARGQEPPNAHTIADTLHEKLAAGAVREVAAQGFDPAKINWLEIAHELIERRKDPLPAQEHASGDAGGIALAAGPKVAPEAMEGPGMPVPDDPAAVSLFTAHRVHEILHKLGHASQRMTAARDAKGDLRRYHAARLAGHVKAAQDAAHDLAAHVKAHYGPEAAELEQVKQAVGLAKAVSGDARAATTAHLLETSLHELAHADRHARQMTEDTPDGEWAFNADHAEKHLGGAAEHAGKLADHFRDNYPDEAHWLNGLHGAGDSGEGKPGQHARYAGAKGAEMASEGTIGAQMAG